MNCNDKNHFYSLSTEPRGHRSKPKNNLCILINHKNKYLEFHERKIRKNKFRQVFQVGPVGQQLLNPNEGSSGGAPIERIFFLI